MFSPCKSMGRFISRSQVAASCLASFQGIIPKVMLGACRICGTFPNSLGGNKMKSSRVFRAWQPTLRRKPRHCNALQRQEAVFYFILAPRALSWRAMARNTIARKEPLCASPVVMVAKSISRPLRSWGRSKPARKAVASSLASFQDIFGQAAW